MERWDKIHDSKPRLSSLRAIKSGYLKKRGAVVKSWKKRYFVLTEHHLLYYYESHSNDLSFKGVIYIKEAKIDVLNTALGAHDVFEIAPQTARHPGWTKDNTEKFYIAASNKQEMEEWVQILAHHTKVHAPTNKTNIAAPPSSLSLPPPSLTVPPPYTAAPAYSNDNDNFSPPPPPAHDDPALPPPPQFDNYNNFQAKHPNYNNFQPNYDDEQQGDNQQDYAHEQGDSSGQNNEHQEE